MTKEEFKELAEKHLFILEGYTMDEEGNKEMQIFGFDKLYEALNMRIVSRSTKVKINEPFEVDETSERYIAEINNFVDDNGLWDKKTVIVKID